MFLLAYSWALHLAALWNPKAKLWVNGRKGWKNKVDSYKLAGESRESGVRSRESGVISQESGVISQESGVKSQKSKVKNDEPATLNPQPATHNPQPATRNPQPTTRNSQPVTPTIWMHCASLGEFEQGRPLLEAIKAQYPDHKIVLTFFSPSGFEVRKNYSGADLVMYLPMDSAANANAFIDAINPSLVLWVKYEYWYYYLAALKNRKIPVLLVSGIFRKNQPFFKWYGNFWKKMLLSFEHLFVQTDFSKVLLQNIGLAQNAVVSGDTRFDRVSDIAAEWQSLGEPIEKFCEGHSVLVAGSTWEEDEETLIHYARAYPAIRFIIAPHEISKIRITELQQEFPRALLYSSLLNNSVSINDQSNVLIIDNIGTLSRLYKYATVTYVGGGFNQSGIHNILEAAVYGKPVIVGPVYEKFAEAKGLVDAGGAYSIENALELEALLNRLFNNPEEIKNSSSIAKEFVYSHQGATSKIMDYIYKNRLLIN